MVDIQSPTAEIRQGKKEEEEDRNHGKNIMACPFHRVAIIMCCANSAAKCTCNAQEEKHGKKKMENIATKMQTPRQYLKFKKQKYRHF